METRYVGTKNFQTIGWFRDLYKRQLLIMDPPYQRRSVWNKEYKEYFIDTILNEYPAPAIFLFRETSPDGISKYSVVDGKQRLSTLFEFADNLFPVGDKATQSRLRGEYFSDLPDHVKTSFWNYSFSIEYLPTSNEEVLNNIFDRINRNVAKLTPQELRHAKFSGEFISAVEELSVWMSNTLPPNVPNIPDRTKRQMKDDEFVSQLLLLIEEGPRKITPEDLDRAFGERDETWENKEAVIDRFREVITYLSQLDKTGKNIFKSRLRNQVDFFSLFGAVGELIEEGKLKLVKNPTTALENFIKLVDDRDQRLLPENKLVNDYFEATRFSSNDTAPRALRISTIKSVLLGEN